MKIFPPRIILPARVLCHASLLVSATLFYPGVSSGIAVAAQNTLTTPEAQPALSPDGSRAYVDKVKKDEDRPSVHLARKGQKTLLVDEKKASDKLRTTALAFSDKGTYLIIGKSEILFSVYNAKAEKSPEAIATYRDPTSRDQKITVTAITAKEMQNELSLLIAFSDGKVNLYKVDPNKGKIDSDKGSPEVVDVQPTTSYNLSGSAKVVGTAFTADNDPVVFAKETSEASAVYRLSSKGEHERLFEVPEQAPLGLAVNSKGDQYAVWAKNTVYIWQKDWDRNLGVQKLTLPNLSSVAFSATGALQYAAATSVNSVNIENLKINERIALLAQLKANPQELTDLKAKVESAREAAETAIKKAEANLQAVDGKVSAPSLARVKTDLPKRSEDASKRIKDAKKEHNSLNTRLPKASQDKTPESGADTENSRKRVDRLKGAGINAAQVITQIKKEIEAAGSKQHWETALKDRAALQARAQKLESETADILKETRKLTEPYKLVENKTQLEPPVKARIMAMAFENGSSSQRVLFASMNSGVARWDTAAQASPQPTGRFGDPDKAETEIHGILPLGDGIVITAGKDGEVRRWNTADPNARPETLLKPDATLYALQQNPKDHGNIVVGGRDKKVHFLTIDHKGPAPSLTLSESVFTLAFNSDGTQLAAGCLDGKLWLIDTTDHLKPRKLSVSLEMHYNKAAENEPKLPNDNPVLSMAFLSKRHLLLGVKYGHLILVDTEHTSDKNAALKQQGGHTGGVTCMAYDPNRNYLVTGGVDGKVRAWNVLFDPKKENIVALIQIAEYAFSTGDVTAEPEGVRSIAISGDSAPVVVSGGTKGTIKQWALTATP